MTRSPVEDARVTIVMTARERHSLTEAAIASVITETTLAFRFLYVDVQSPASLRQSLARLVAEGALEVLTVDEPLSPQQARLRAVDSIETEFTVFIDNDVQVEAGWLEALVACADATGAGIVGPVYLWGDGVGPSRIHMAGGRLSERVHAQGRSLDEAHLLVDEDPRRAAEQLSRRPCDFVEFHCMLIRTQLARASILDSALQCVHEHIDTSLSAKARGFATYVEPDSRVTYLAFADYMLDDLPLFRERWSEAQADADIAAFCAKWNVVDDARSFGSVRQFVRKHVADVDPIRAEARNAARQATPMQPHELAQTRSALLDLAASLGYAHDQIALIANAYHVASVLLDGGYRPCGRPFINHAVGTAGVLVRYGFQPVTVAAGLLHAAYTHCPPHQGGTKAGIDAVAIALGGRTSAIERRVRDYTLRETARSAALAHDVSTLSVPEAEILAIAAANELDMHLSGEFRFSGRDDGLRPEAIAALEPLCALLGASGLHRSLVLAQAAHTLAPRALLSPVPYSYRIGPDKRTAVPLVNVAAIELIRSGLPPVNAAA